MKQPLSTRTIALVKATVPALEAHGLEIVKEMYARMFQNAEIRDLFNQSHHGDAGSQPRALTGAILAYASNIDNLAALAPAVERIAQKHVGLQILPEHYPHVADALLGLFRFSPNINFLGSYPRADRVPVDYDPRYADGVFIEARDWLRGLIGGEPEA